MATQSENSYRKLTVQEVLRMLEVGILGPDEPLELLDGRLVFVSPQGPVHINLTVIVRMLLERLYAGLGYAQDHSNIDAGPHDMPEPDVAVVKGDPRARIHQLARGEDIILVVEVAQTTHRESRAKAPIYARAGVPVMWLVDVPGRRVEVYSGGATAAGDYARMEIIDEGGHVDLPVIGGQLAVSELLP